jgi:hypothetical protein
MNRTNLLIDEMKLPPNYEFYPHYFRAIGYRQTTHTTPSLKRADGIASLFTEPAPFIYKNDMIVGSLRTLCLPLTEAEKKAAEQNEYQQKLIASGRAPASQDEIPDWFKM